MAKERNRFIAEADETEALTGLEHISGDVPLTAEQLHERHRADLKRAQAEAEKEKPGGADQP